MFNVYTQKKFELKREIDGKIIFAFGFKEFTTSDEKEISNLLWFLIVKNQHLLKSKKSMVYY